MNQRHLLILLCILVVSGAGWLAWWAAAGQQAASSNPLAGLPDAADAPAIEVPQRLEEAPAEDRVAVPPEVVAALPSSIGLAVRVVDEAGAPVAGAAVSVHSGDDRVLFSDSDAAGESRSNRLPTANLWLVARRGDQVGFGSWSRIHGRHREVVIRMQAARTLQVVMHDAAGRPVPGLAVGVRSGNGGYDRTDPQLRAIGDAAGQASIVIDGRHPAVLRQAQVQVVVRAPFGDTESPALDWQRDAATVIEIVVEPPAGAVLTVRFVDDVGAPVEVAGRLSWSTVRRQGIGTVVWPAGSCEAQGNMAKVHGLGAEAELKLTLDEPGRMEAAAAAKLPEGASSFEVVMRRGAPMPRLELPLVDERGHPVTEGAFGVFVQQARLGTGEREVQPDQRGMIELAMNEVAAGQLELFLRRRADCVYLADNQRLPRPYNTTFGKLPPPEPALAVRDFPALAPAQVLRLDAFVVPTLRVAVRGRVIDQQGAPVAGMPVLLSCAEEPAATALQHVLVRSEDDGHFVVYADRPLPADVWCCGRALLQFCEPRSVSATGEVQLLALAGGTVRCDLRLPPLIGKLPDRKRNQGMVRATLVLTESSLDSGREALFRDRTEAGQRDLLGEWAVSRWQELDQPVEFEGLVPGLYRLRAQVGLNELASVDEIRVQAGEVNEVLLEGAVTAVEAVSVRVLDRDRQPIENARVRFVLPAWRESLPTGVNEATDADGAAWFVVPRGTVVDLEVVAAGQATRKIAAVALPAEVVMSTGASFTVAIDGLATLQGKRAFVVSLTETVDAPKDTPLISIGEFTQVGHPQVNLGADGKGELANVPPGRYRLWLSAVAAIGARDPSTNFIMLRDFEIAVGDDSAVPIVRALDAVQLRQLQGN